MHTDLLRFTTAGSVDDGKSTLIGRLLYDTKSIFDDQLNAIERVSSRKGLSHLDLSLLTDGLRDEREQGITIDVAFRYFSTPHRKFIIADTPGHIQYTRNMVTGASTANLALILVDARQGVNEQTRRHSFIASLLQIQHLVICVNKMDLVNYDEAVFEQIVSDYNDFASRLDIHDFHFIPISALHGDNVVNRSEKMTWYNGPTLLHTLENVPVANDVNHVDMRFPVQTVIRPHSTEHHDFRGYAGRLASGLLRKGDVVTVLPSGISTTVKSVHTPAGTVDEAFAPQSITIELNDDVDVSRGDMIVRQGNQPKLTQDIQAMICWLGDEPVSKGSKWLIRHTSRESRVILQSVEYRLDMERIQRETDVLQLQKNDIARITLRAALPLCTDSYRLNRVTGSFILIDPVSCATVAAGMIL
jgi:sulfate adenylyltransferase subunit 1